MPYPYNLDRFVQAQAPVMANVNAELAAGHKRNHWMWFVFPQLAGLGRSDMARRYAIAARAEAQAYLAHPVLGSRLLRCTGLVNAVQHRSATQIFGSPDDMKFHSCMTLFSLAAPGQPAFQTALARYFGNTPDPATVEKLGPGPTPSPAQ